MAPDTTHVYAALEVLHNRERTIEINTISALSFLVSHVCERSNHSTSDHPINSTKLASAYTNPTVPSLHVFMYFDEAHALARWPGSNGAADIGKVPLDVLVRTLDRFQHLGAFTVLLSTQSQLEYLVPSSLSTRSARYRGLVDSMRDPITETPFDCIPGKLAPSDFTASHVGEVEFMAQFGRPLWASMLSRCAESHNVSKGDSIDGETLLTFARSKLLCQELVSCKRLDYSEIAQTAVLDARITLAYKAGRGATHAHQHQMDLVASHMRTIYFIPYSREYIHSGYSSEPILAEAAARQLHSWRELEMQEPAPVEPAVAILQDNLNHDLLARGEIGEAVGRLLLIIAHDRAVEEDTLKKAVLHFSSPISVADFFKALFPEEIAERVLDSVPDNQVNGKTLRDAFKDAVLNFTHFAKWADDSSLLEASAAGCFMLHMAVICRNNGLYVDVFLPILLDREAPLRPENMSGIFVQFKLREKRGSLSAYAIDEKRIKFFSPDEEAVENGLRPYITLIMELGVVNPPPRVAQTPTDPHSKTVKKLEAQIHKESNTLTRDSTAHATPSNLKIHISDASARSSRKGAHPRYSMYVYGSSSPSVYKVIREEERDIYKQIIRSGDVLGEQQKPFWVHGPASWHWFKNKDINPDKLTAVGNGEEGNIYIRIGIPEDGGEGGSGHA